MSFGEEGGPREFGLVTLWLPGDALQSWAQSLETAARNTAWAGGRLQLFWPVEPNEAVLGLWVPQATPWRPANQIADELGAEVRSENWITPHVPTLAQDAPASRWRAITAAALQELQQTVAALPWPGGRCAGCGAERPPHLPGCPYAL